MQKTETLNHAIGDTIMNNTIKPRFAIGDKVAAIALPNAFPEPRERVEGLQITRVTLNTWIEGTTDRSYYRVVAEPINGYGFYEGAERFFEAMPVQEVL